MHGGRIWEAARQLRTSYRDILDFSANINPYGPPESVLRAISASLSEIAHYPDPDAIELTTAIAASHSIDPGAVAVANGGSEAITLLPPALGLSCGICCSPTFSEYAAAMETWGKQAIALPGAFSPGERRFERAIEKAACAATPGSAVFICNPNNPTGEYAPPDILIWAWKRVRSVGGTLVVDESFMDFVDYAGAPGAHNSSILPRLAAQSEGLVIIRSMTKFYALPGLRLGYAVAEPGACGRLKRTLPRWSVNHLAQRAGVAALNDSHFRGTALRIARHREELRLSLGNTALVTAFPSAANFLLVRLEPQGSGPEDSAALCCRMQDRGVLVRDCSSFAGMGSRYIRVAVRLPEDNLRLVNTLSETLGDADYGK